MVVPYDNFLCKAFKARQRNRLRTNSAALFIPESSLYRNPSRFALRLSFHTEIFGVPFFCKLADHFQSIGIFFLDPTELNDGI